MFFLILHHQEKEREMYLLIFTTAEIVMLIALFILFLTQVIYHVGLYGTVYRHLKDDKKGNLPYQAELLPVSVIITARDDSANLEKFLPSVLTQDYPNFEVIVVNDGATDDSNDLLTLMSSKYKNLYHTFTPNNARYVSSKKLALTVGIKAAKHDWLVFTEANCQPVSDQWLRMMARNFTESTEIVLGYNTYQRGEAMWQHKIKFFNFFNQIRSLSFALSSKAYMGIGRNMAYRKDLFFKNKGYSKHLNLKGGYDDVFINEVATPYNTRVELNPDSIVLMEPFEEEHLWQEERTNYRSTARLYHGHQCLLLGLETCTRLLFLLSEIGVIIYSSVKQQWVILGISAFLLIVYNVMHIWKFNNAARALCEPKHYFTYVKNDWMQPWESLKNKIAYISSDKKEYSR